MAYSGSSIFSPTRRETKEETPNFLRLETSPWWMDEYLGLHSSGGDHLGLQPVFEVRDWCSNWILRCADLPAGGEAWNMQSWTFNMLTKPLTGNSCIKPKVYLCVYTCKLLENQLPIDFVF